MNPERMQAWANSTRESYIAAKAKEEKVAQRAANRERRQQEKKAREKQEKIDSLTPYREAARRNRGLVVRSRKLLTVAGVDREKEGRVSVDIVLGRTKDGVAVKGSIGIERVRYGLEVFRRASLAVHVDNTEQEPYGEYTTWSHLYTAKYSGKQDGDGRPIYVRDESKRTTVLRKDPIYLAGSHKGWGAVVLNKLNSPIPYDYRLLDNPVAAFNRQSYAFEQTLKMFEDAACNPDLNPEIAERIRIREAEAQSQQAS